jgi:hypothetical protein
MIIDRGSQILQFTARCGIGRSLRDVGTASLTGHVRQHLVTKETLKCCDAALRTAGRFQKEYGVATDDFEKPLAENSLADFKVQKLNSLRIHGGNYCRIPSQKNACQLGLAASFTDGASSFCSVRTTPNHQNGGRARLAHVPDQSRLVVATRLRVAMRPFLKEFEMTWKSIKTKTKTDSHSPTVSIRKKWNTGGDISLVKVPDIVVPDELEKPDPGDVAKLVESIRKVGIIHPVTVRRKVTAFGRRSEIELVGSYAVRSIQNARRADDSLHVRRG